jgi:hypothetical protein
MPNEAQNTPATPGRRYWWRRGLNLALLGGSIAATMIALTVVVALFWWLSGPVAQKPTALAPRPPAGPLQAAAEPAPRPAVPAAPAPAPAAPRAPAPTPAGYANRPSAAAPVPAGPPRRRVYKRTGDGDAERNRAIAQGLQELARDPEALRQLGLPEQGPSQ